MPDKQGRRLKFGDAKGNGSTKSKRCKAPFLVKSENYLIGNPFLYYILDQKRKSITLHLQGLIFWIALQDTWWNIVDFMIVVRLFSILTQIHGCDRMSFHALKE